MATLSTALVLALVAGTVVSLMLASRATREAGRANLAAEDARAQQRRAVEAAARERVERDRASAQEAVAVAERDRAGTALAELRASQKKLVASEAAARQAAEEARRSAEEARRGAYAARVVLAGAQIQAGDFAQASRSLEQCDEALRGVEWRLLSIWAEVGGRPKAEFVHPARIAAAAICPDAATLAVASRDGEVTLYRLPAGEEVWSASLAYPNMPMRLALSRDGALLALQGVPTREAADAMGTGGELAVLLVDATTGDPIRAFEPIGHEVLGGLLFDAGANFLAGSGVAHGRGYVWEVETGRLRRAFSNDPDRTDALAFVADGAAVSTGRLLFALGGDDPEGPAMKSLEATPGARTTTALRYSGSGRLFAEATDSLEIALKDAETGRVLRSLSGHTQAIRDLRFLDGDRRLLSAGDEGAVRLWDVESVLRTRARREEARTTAPGRSGRRGR